MSEENVEIVRRFAGAVSRDDREAVAPLIHPEVEWHTMGGPLMGVTAMRGQDETLSFIFERIPEGIEDFRLTADRFTELPGDQLLVCGHYAGRGTSSKAELKISYAALYRFDAGKIIFFQDFPSEAEALEAVGLSE